LSLRAAGGAKGKRKEQVRYRKREQETKRPGGLAPGQGAFKEKKSVGGQSSEGKKNTKGGEGRTSQWRSKQEGGGRGNRGYTLPHEGLEGTGLMMEETVH